MGKAALEAVSVLQKILGSRLTDGFVLDVKPGEFGDKITVRAGTHPLTSEINRDNTRQLLDKFKNNLETDLDIFVVSGGGSSLLCAPYLQTPEQAAEIFRVLTAQGASIVELNTVRKHTDLVKGGALAKMLFPATVVSLIFSDIPGNDLGMVASGPLVLDTTTVKDASAILGKYQVLEKLGRKKIDLLETPKEIKYFANTQNFLLVSGQQALSAMRSKAEDLGFSVKNFSDQFQGEARFLGGEIAGGVKKGSCVLGVGESTVRLSGKGHGGRNQEMALGALSAMRGDVVMGCFASDGHDNTEAAGALVDTATLTRAKKLGLNLEACLKNNDSFKFLENTGDLVYTGLTGANIADFFVCLKR